MPPNREYEQVLSRKSPAYLAHKDMILDADAEARRQIGFYTDCTRRSVMQTTRIICHRSMQVRGPSVSRQYYNFLLWALRVRENGQASETDRQTAEAIFQLAPEVLAIHLSIAEEPQSMDAKAARARVEQHARHVRELEQTCTDHAIPSLLPNLMIPASLQSRLETDGYRPAFQDGAQEVFASLETLFERHPAHFAAVMEGLLFHHRPADVMHAVERCADGKQMDTAEMLRGHLPLARTYVASLIELTYFEAAATVCERIGREQIGRYCPLAVDYLHALFQTGRREEIRQFLHTCPKVLLTDPDSADMLCYACEEIGRWLLESSRTPESVAMVSELLPYLPTRNRKLRDFLAEVKKAAERAGMTWQMPA